MMDIKNTAISAKVVIESLICLLENENVDISKFKSKWKPYVKYYLSERTKQVSNLWTDIDGNKKGSIELKQLFDKKKLFENPKPTDFLKALESYFPPVFILETTSTTFPNGMPRP